MEGQVVQEGVTAAWGDSSKDLVHDDGGEQEVSDIDDQAALAVDLDETSLLLFPPSSRIGIEHPRDPYHLVYLVFFLSGLSTMLPWNFFISLNGYWNYKFRDVNTSSSSSSNSNLSDTELQKEFTSYLSIASNVPNALFVILNAIYGIHFAVRKRILYSSTTIIFLFTLVTALAAINSDAWQHTFLYFTLTLVVLININTAIFQGSVFGVAGKFPQKYMGIAMTGQAIGGVFPALVDILVISSDVDLKNVGFACFLVATVVLLFTLLAFMWTGHSHFFRYYSGEEGPHPQNEESAGDPDDSPPPPEDADWRRFLHVLTHSWQYCLSLFVTFGATLSVYPALTVLVKSQTTEGSWATLYFSPVCNFLLFNVGDLVGRSLANWLQWPHRTLWGKALVVAASMMRLVLVPMFLLCNASPKERTLPVVFGTDAEFVTLLAFFAVSNGYIGNICMLQGPKTEAASVMQEEAAMVLVASLVVGIGVGSFLSYPIVNLL